MANWGGKFIGKTGIKVRRESVESIHESLKALAAQEVLVGFPEDTTERKDGDALTNAELAYIHDNGAPEANIPARPFMIPAITENSDKIATALGNAAKAILRDKGPLSVQQGLTRAGIVAVTAIKRKINEGIPPPLSDYTLRQRARKGRKGAKKELELRAQGEAPSMEFAKPLVDSGQMRNAANFVIRPRRARKV